MKERLYAALLKAGLANLGVFTADAEETTPVAIELKCITRTSLDCKSLPCDCSCLCRFYD